MLQEEIDSKGGQGRGLLSSHFVIDGMEGGWSRPPSRGTKKPGSSPARNHHGSRIMMAAVALLWPRPQVLKARLPPGTEVDPRDMKATEEFLLDMLGSAGGAEEGGAEESGGARAVGSGGSGSAEEAIQAEMMAALEPGSGKSDAEVLEILQRHLASTASAAVPPPSQQPAPAQPRTSRTSFSALSTGSGGIGSNGRRSGGPSASNSMRMRTEVEPYGSMGGGAGDDGSLGEYAADFAALDSSLGGGAGSAAPQLGRSSTGSGGGMARPPQKQAPPPSASSRINVDTLEELAASLSQWDHVLEPSKR